MEKSWICKNCNAENGGELDYCWKCGYDAPLAVRPPLPKSFTPKEIK